MELEKWDYIPGEILTPYGLDGIGRPAKNIFIVWTPRVEATYSHLHVSVEVCFSFTGTEFLPAASTMTTSGVPVPASKDKISPSIKTCF